MHQLNESTSSAESDSDSWCHSDDSTSDNTAAEDYSFDEPLETQHLEEDPSPCLYQLSALTSRDILDHNRRFGMYAVWWKSADVVYDVRRLYLLLSAAIRAKCQQSGMTACEYVTSVRDVIRHSHPPFQAVLRIARRLKLPTRDVSRALTRCKIGHMYQPTFEEKCNDMATGVDQILESLRENESKYMLSQQQQQQQQNCSLSLSSIQEYLNSFMKLCTEIKRQPGYASSCFTHGGDVNLQPYRIPPWCEPDSLRTFLHADYDAFDTRVTNDVIARKPTQTILCAEVCDDVFKSALRPYLNDTTLHPFRTDINGDVAWTAPLASDIVKRDVTTRAQNALIQQRSRRRHFGDEVAMRRRRDELFDYFLANYFTHNPSDVDPYRQWADRMREGESQFQMLLQ